MSKKSEQRPEPDFAELFRQSLLNWGGWQKLVTGSAEVFVEPVSETVQAIAQHQAKSPARIGTLSPEEWRPIATTLPAFLNAYLQQELDRVLEGPRDFFTVLRLVDDNLTAQLLFSVVIVARELHLDVEVSCKNPYGSKMGRHVCHLSADRCLATLTIEIGREHGEEHLPLVLHVHGEEMVWDKDESTPQNPVWVPVPVDRKGVVYSDGSNSGSLTLQQRRRDDFLHTQGFEPIRFSKAQLERDLFRCAADAVKLVAGKDLPPPNS
jgi:hypothetical protein